MNVNIYIDKEERIMAMVKRYKIMISDGVFEPHTEWEHYDYPTEEGAISQIEDLLHHD
jgi:peroxiredoxin